MIARLRPEARYKDIFLSFFINGNISNKLENKLIDYLKVKNVLLTQSGRAGLYFLFKALPQKIVFIPSYTCWVVVEAAYLAKKEVEFIDIRLTDYNMDPEILKRKIQPNSIILATHQFGIPCDMDEILKIANDNQCYVIEDNAAAFGSEYNGKKTGSFGDASIISFEFTKVLTSCRGGAVLFNDEKLYKEVKKLYELESIKSSRIFTLKYISIMLINKFITQKWIYKVINMLFLKAKGFTTASPAYKKEPDILYTNQLSKTFMKLAYININRIEEIITKRKNIVLFYDEMLKKSEYLVPPIYPPNKSPIFMRYPIRIIKMEKEIFYTIANKRGVDLAFTFPYSCDTDKENSPNAFIAASSVLNLPYYSSLNTNDLAKTIKSIQLQ